MGRPESVAPRIHWHQLTLLQPTLIECNLRITAHGPSGAAMIGLWSRDGDPGNLVMQELYTNVPLSDVEPHALELLRQMIPHELGRLTPF